MKRLVNWLANLVFGRKPAPPTDLRATGSHLRQTGTHPVPRRSPRHPALPARQPEVVDVNRSNNGFDTPMSDEKGLIRNKFVRENTGTHDTLKILDDSLIETHEETGIDPYNTGNFDRSKNWDKRFRG